MIIESVQVIPMSKESKWEEKSKMFEVSMITTNFVEWEESMLDDLKSHPEFENVQKPVYNSDCARFAINQQAFMLAPTAIFGSQVFAAKTKPAETLDDIILEGPLYQVFLITVGDNPPKKMYNIRYGSLMNV